MGGRLVRTTPEHPFFVAGKGWVEGGILAIGNLLCSRDGQIVAVEIVEDTGEYETVFNCRVGEWHTCFVGGEEWNSDLRAHNSGGFSSGSTGSPIEVNQATIRKALQGRHSS